MLSCICVGELRKQQVSCYTTVGGGSQFLKGSRTCAFWANASLVFCLFRHSIKKLWREGRSHTPARLRRLSSCFSNLLSTLVRFAANGALWWVYYFVHRIIRPSVKITCAILSYTMNVRMPPFLALRINRWVRFDFCGSTVLVAYRDHPVSFNTTVGGGDVV